MHEKMRRAELCWLNRSFFWVVMVALSCPVAQGAVSVDGADGLVVTNGVIAGGTYVGGLGDAIIVARGDVSADGGAGVLAFGNTTVIDGAFVGGDGGRPLSFDGHLSADGGAGLSVHEGSTTVLGGSFSGGAAGFVYTNYNDSGTVGEQGVGIQSTTGSGDYSSLTILGGAISNGIRIAADGDALASLHVSTNAVIEGPLIKTGSGTLALRDWEEGTLQQIAVEGGRVNVTNRYVLESDGEISLHADGAVFQALDGMEVHGSLEGISGSVFLIHSNLTLSGTVAASVELTGIDGNILLLQGGADVADATFAGNGLVDRLQLTRPGTYSAASLGMGSRFVDFEQVALSSEADVWELTSADLLRTDFSVDGGDGSDDMLAMAQGGTYDLTAFNLDHNTGFELFGLSTSADAWIAGTNDAVLGYIDARSGIDQLDFSAHRVASAAIGDSGTYRNFEGIRLSAGNDTWNAGANYSQMDFINAYNGLDTLSYAGLAAVSTNSLDMGPSAFYRGFERVALTSFGDIWSVGAGDVLLDRIDGAGGDDLLKVIGNHAWTALDSARYLGFEQLLVEGGTLSVGGEPLVFDDVQLSESALRIGSGSTVVAGTYFQDSTSLLWFTASTNTPSAGAGLTAALAVIETNATVRFDVPVADFARHERYTNLVVDAGTLVLAGETNAFNLDALVLDESLLVARDWYVGDDGSSIFAVFDRRSLLETAGVESNTPLGSVLVEIDTLPTEEADRMLSFIDKSGMTPGELVDNLAMVYERSIASPRLAGAMRAAALQQMLDRTEIFRLEQMLRRQPEGASGPPSASSELAGWFKGVVGMGTSDADGYDQSLFGTAFGLDRCKGPLLLGVSAGYLQGRMDFENNDELSAPGYYASLYASLGTEGPFVESSLSYCTSEMTYGSGSRFDLGSSYNVRDVVFHLGTGYLLKDEGVLLVPNAAITVNQFSQAGFTDESINAVPTMVEPYDYLGMQGRIGISGVLNREFAKMDWLANVRFQWLHEFIEGDDRLGYALLGGADEHSFAVLMPSMDLADIGVNLQCRINRALSVQAAFDYLFSDLHSAYHVGMGLIYSF